MVCALVDIVSFWPRRLHSQNLLVRPRGTNLRQLLRTLFSSFSMEHNSFPEVTLSALAETGQVESSIPVLKQRSYIGRNPVISSALANTPCADLGVDGVLEKLNATLGTAYNLDLPCVFGKVLNAKPQRKHSRMEMRTKLAHFKWTVMGRNDTYFFTGTGLPRSHR